MSCLIRIRSESHNGPVTGVFKTLNVAAVVHAALEATAPWGLTRDGADAEFIETHSDGKNVSPCQLAHFGMVTRGNCWLTVNGIPDPIRLTGGDCFIVGPGTSYALRETGLRGIGMTFGGTSFQITEKQ